MDLVLRPHLYQGLDIRLTVHQRLKIEQMIAVRLESLVRDLQDERYEPEKVSCLKCQYVMTKEDILKGFNNDPQDYTTGCPNCGFRFTVNLVSFNRIYLPFLCASQTLFQLKDSHQEQLCQRSPKFIAKKFPSVYRSALYHFGTLNEAFGKIGKKYTHSPIHTWEAKVVPYLGTLTDTLIAELVKVPVHKVRKMRVSLNISRYLKSKDI